MSDERLGRLAQGIILGCVAVTAALLLLAILESATGAYQRSTVFVAASFFLLGLAVFVYERAFTPGVVWVLKDGKRAGRIVRGEVVLDPEFEEAK